jgi:hypothetical protein
MSLIFLFIVFVCVDAYWFANETFEEFDETVQTLSQVDCFALACNFSTWTALKRSVYVPVYDENGRKRTIYVNSAEQEVHTRTNTGFIFVVVVVFFGWRFVAVDRGCAFVVERTNMGLPPLYASWVLAKTARDHSEDMRAQNYFSHTSLDGRSPFQRMSDNGYVYSSAAENIARGQPTPQSVVLAWMNSAGHRANILRTTVNELGVGLSTSGLYWFAIRFWLLSAAIG